MKDKIINILKFTLFVAIGASLFYLAYKDQNIEEIKDALRHADYFWLGLSLLIALASHLSRAIRWNILLEPLGHTPKLHNTFFAVMAMYLANIAFPRMGEVTRCGILKRYEKISISKSLGTVVVERIVDFILLIVLFIIVLISQFDEIIHFLEQNIDSKYSDVFSSPLFLFSVGITGAGSLVFLYLIRDKLRQIPLYQKAKDSILNFIEGIRTIKKLERRAAFIFHSLFIYLMYFLMLYVCFFAFEFTSHLSAMIGLTVFVLASFGMVAPSPGGIGSWHLMTIGTLLIYNINETEARAFAFAVHGSMTLMLIVVGFISLVALPIFNKKETQNIENTMSLSHGA